MKLYARCPRCKVRYLTDAPAKKVKASARQKREPPWLCQRCWRREWERMEAERVLSGQT